MSFSVFYGTSSFVRYIYYEYRTIVHIRNENKKEGDVDTEMLCFSSLHCIA